MPVFLNVTHDDETTSLALNDGDTFQDASAQLGLPATTHYKAGAGAIYGPDQTVSPGHFEARVEDNPSSAPAPAHDGLVLCDVHYLNDLKTVALEPALQHSIRQLSRAAGLPTDTVYTRVDGDGEFYPEDSLINGAAYRPKSLSSETEDESRNDVSADTPADAPADASGDGAATPVPELSAAVPELSAAVAHGRLIAESEDNVDALIPQMQRELVHATASTFPIGLYKMKDDAPMYPGKVITVTGCTLMADTSDNDNTPLVNIIDPTGLPVSMRRSLFAECAAL